MARTLRHYPKPNKRDSLYPWDTWLDGRVWKLTKGPDFECECNSLRGAAYAAAARAGVTVKVTVDGDHVILQAGVE